jgi:hypothetical protein
MNRDDEKEEIDLEREIIKGMLLRGETDRVFATRGIAFLITGGLILLSLLVGCLIRFVGSQ